jgi:hypothetical protein
VRLRPAPVPVAPQPGPCPALGGLRSVQLPRPLCAVLGCACCCCCCCGGGGGGGCGGCGGGGGGWLIAAWVCQRHRVRGRGVGGGWGWRGGGPGGGLGFGGGGGRDDEVAGHVGHAVEVALRGGADRGEVLPADHLPQHLEPRRQLLRHGDGLARNDLGLPRGGGELDIDEERGGQRVGVRRGGGGGGGVVGRAALGRVAVARGGVGGRLLPADLLGRVLGVCGVGGWGSGDWFLEEAVGFAEGVLEDLAVVLARSRWGLLKVCAQFTGWMRAVESGYAARECVDCGS